MKESQEKVYLYIQEKKYAGDAEQKSELFKFRPVANGRLLTLTMAWSLCVPPGPMQVMEKVVVVVKLVMVNVPLKATAPFGHWAFAGTAVLVQEVALDEVQFKAIFAPETTAKGPST